MKLRILLVDDEDTILVTTRAILELSGYEVETAVSAADAQAKLMSETFDIVLTDMKMETNTAGFDVVRVGRSRGNPAIAILTAHPNLGSDWKREGAHALFIKPMDTDDLLRHIDALLVQHQQEGKCERI